MTGEPLDMLHLEAVEARADIRRWFAAARLAASHWEPAPCPPAPLRRAASAPSARRAGTTP